MSSRGLSTATHILATSALVACGAGDAGDDAIRSDSAGIEIVVSPAADRLLRLDRETVLTLGGAVEGPESFYRLAASIVGADAAGNLYVLNTEDNTVAVFAADGRYLRTLGGSGGGPGEVRGAGSIAVSADGTVAVFDWGKRALIRWGPDRETLPELLFPHVPFPSGQRHVLPVAGGYAVSTYGTGGEGPANVLRIVGADSAMIARVDLPRGKMAMYESCGGGLNLPPIFSPEVVWDARGDTIAYGFGPAYAVAVLEDDRVVRSVRRDLPPREATPALALLELGEGMTIDFGRGPCVIPPEDMIDDRGVAPWVQAIRSIGITPEGGLWVERWEPGRDPGPIDVFDPSGAYAGTLPEASPFPVLFLPDGRIGVVESDENDVERLVILRVDW